jgi:hypothetical protein
MKFGPKKLHNLSICCVTFEIIETQGLANVNPQPCPTKVNDSSFFRSIFFCAQPDTQEEAYGYRLYF